MRKSWVMVCFLAQTLSAQDLHFSQAADVPLLINPAHTGLIDGWERINLVHRQQQLGSGGNFVSTYAGLDANLFRESSRGGYLGVGGTFYNDVAGDGRLGRTQGNLSLSGLLPLKGESQILGAGIAAGLGQSTLQPQNLRFENQWNGETYDGDILSGETFEGSWTYTDISAGVIYRLDGTKSGFSGKNASIFTIGISGYHLNQPLLKYRAGGKERLAPRYVAHVDYLFDIGRTDWQMEMRSLYARQNQQDQVLNGLMWRYVYAKSGLMYGAGANYFGFGLAMRDLSALIVQTKWQLKGLQIGLSYDAIVSSLSNARGAGAIELTLGYTNFRGGLANTRRQYK